MLQNASLDTSFWNIATQIGLVPYLFNYFRIHYCQAVEDEIVTKKAGQTTLIYPQAMLFRVMKEDGRLFVAEPQQPIPLFGMGEAHAVALAREQHWTLLINDYRPLIYARFQGIHCVSVPDFCAVLYSDKVITFRAAQGFIHRTNFTTSADLIQQAHTLLEKIAQKRGEL